MIQAVIIDLDDTLCLTEAASFEMENLALASLGRPPMSREIHVSTWGGVLAEVITARSPGVDPDAFKVAFRPVITKYVQTGKLDVIPPENYAALDRLIEIGKSLMLLTSRTHDELQHLLEPDHLLAARVQAFYYRDNMQYHKPDSRAFAELLQDSGLQPSQCVYVGDSVGDAVAAKTAGLHFIASLESGLRQKSDFEHLPVDKFINKFPEVVPAVAGLDDSEQRL